jgi:hypothetical protein
MVNCDIDVAAALSGGDPVLRKRGMEHAAVEAARQQLPE